MRKSRNIIQLLWFILLCSALKAWAIPIAHTPTYLSGYSALEEEVYSAAQDPSSQVLCDPTAVVPPLLRGLIWGQGHPYDLFTPEIRGAHTLTGCNATACAQIMRYYAWPPQGKGTVQGEHEFCTKPFDWAKMPNDATNASQEEKEAVAYLMREIGKAVKMNYGLGDSPSDFSNIYHVLLEHFDYAPSLRFVRSANYSWRDWQQLILSELQAGRPVIYAGSHYDPAEGGHSFIIDGYDGNGYFHVNWGADDGMYNGYFMLHKLIDGKHNYSYYPMAIIGICPAIKCSAAESEERDYTYDALDADPSWSLGTYPISVPIQDIGVKGLKTKSKVGRPVRLALALLNEKGDEIRRFVSTEQPTTLQPFVYLLRCDLCNCTGVPDGIYSLRPYVYEVDNNAYYPLSSSDKRWVRVSIANSKRTVEVVEDTQPRLPHLEISWKSTTTLHINNYNVVEWSVKNTGTKRYLSAIQASYSDTKTPTPPTSLDDCPILEMVELSPGDEVTFRTPIKGPLRAQDKYLHFFADEQNTFKMGKIATQPIASITIQPAAHYNTTAPDIELLEKTDRVKGGADYIVRFRLNAKGDAGAYLNNWVTYIKGEKIAVLSLLEKLPTYVIEPGKHIEVTLRKPLYLPSGEHYTFFMARKGDDGVLDVLCKYPFAVEQGEYQLPIPTYGTVSHPITLLSAPHGSVKVSEKGKIAADTEVTLTLTPDSHYHLATLTLYKSGEDGVTIPTAKVSDSEYRFKMPAYPVTVQVRFEKDEEQDEEQGGQEEQAEQQEEQQEEQEQETPEQSPERANPCPVTILSSAHGKIEIRNEEELEVDTWVMLEVTPDEDYHLETITIYKSGAKNVKVDYLLASDTECRFTMPDYEVTVEATFEKDAIHSDDDNDAEDD